MRIAMALLAVSLAFGSAACKKKEKAGGGDTTTMGSGSATGSGSADLGSAAGSGSADTGSAAGSGSADEAAAGSGSAAGEASMAKAAGNCPSTVGGSTTKAEVKGKAIVLTITADDKDAVSAIQRRTEEMVAVKKGGGTGTGASHDARGTHRGKTGLCPAHVPEGATIESKKEAKGVTITITPTDKLDELKTEIDARVIKAADWLKANVKAGDKGTTGGVGGGKGEHGGNHSGEGDSKGTERKAGEGSGSGKGDGKGGGKGTGGGGGAGTGGGSSNGSATK